MQPFPRFIEMDRNRLFSVKKLWIYPENPVLSGFSLTFPGPLCYITLLVSFRREITEPAGAPDLWRAAKLFTQEKERNAL